jgi:hypothetical protein
MNQILISQIENDLQDALAKQFNLEPHRVQDLMNELKVALQDGLKQFVIKSGSKELEDLVINTKPFQGSGFQAYMNALLMKILVEKSKIDNGLATKLADFSSRFLVDAIQKAFVASGESPDFDGVCNFLQVDKNLLKMINSPMGKMFGKLF